MHQKATPVRAWMNGLRCRVPLDGKTETVDAMGVSPWSFTFLAFLNNNSVYDARVIRLFRILINLREKRALSWHLINLYGTLLMRWGTNCSSGSVL